MKTVRSLIGLMLLIFTVAYTQQDPKFRIRLNHTTSVQYSPDQSYLCVADQNFMHTFSASTENEIKKDKISKSNILTFSFNSDGSILYTNTTDDLIQYHINKIESPKSWSSKEPILKSLFIEQSIIAFVTDKSLSLFDFSTNQISKIWSEHSKPIRCLDVSKTGNLATGGGDGFVIVYKTDGTIISKKKIHETWVRSISFSPDGLTIASGDDLGNVMLSDLKGNVLYQFTEPKGWVRALRFSGDGKYLAVGDEKGNCYFYWLERKTVSEKFELGQPIIDIAFKDDGKEVVIVEETKGARGWDISPLNISPVFKFKDKKDTSPPQILVSNPPNTQQERVRFSKDMIDIKGTVVDESGVRILKINNIETPIKDNGNFVLYMPLSMGDNFVNIEARDINDNISLKKFIITRKDLSGEEYDNTKARNFLFVVGINDYQHWPKLNNAVKDATDVVSTLLSKYNFDFANVVMLKNEQATRSNIYKSLRGLIEQITPQDNLVIYYSGHGYFDELLNEGYWIPIDARNKESGDYLSNADLLKIISNINSQHTFLVADACFSGSLFSDSKRGYSENVEKFKSRWGLASGRLEVVSDGEVGQNSPFTTIFLEYLKSNEKEKFPVSELIQYVKVKVAEKTTQTPLGNSLKSAGDEGGEFVFYKKKN